MDALNAIIDTNSKNEVSKRKISFSGKALITVTGGIGVTISLVAVAFVAPAFRRYCLPYVPATTEQIKNVLSILPTKEDTQKISKVLLDIGSGDGRIVFATANKGLTSHGVELNRWLVYYSRLKALKNGIKNAKFFQKDLWKYNISTYDYIVIFGVGQMMSDLEKKLVKEAKDSSKIIACRFPFPNLTPIKIIGTGVDTVWLYEIKRF
ncbi:ATP synthase subunit C lysine N-methyltransferase [Condylostylus longicornis]|uniref:ATP synthase subunit C lysine N-methyltransferase n=1 Tax=Condylostylus longicornis TaxID=2530218 RepID=UPI00244DBEC2|nr:ATP synthase subunit C lysine N-methyltransferase [Condylostylus longicornis]